MEFDQDPAESAPVRRKPRSRSPKVVLPEEAPEPEPIPENLRDFKPAEEIPDLPVERMPGRNSGALARWDLAMPVLALAFALFLCSQILAARQASSAMTWRLENLDRQAVALKGVRDNAAVVLQQRQGLIQETQRVSNNYNALLTELLKLAETDKDARSVVEKFNIKNAAPAQPTPAPKK